jgi:hypothetical protein
MATVSFPLDEGQERKLNALAATVRRPTQDLCREALEEYLLRHERRADGTGVEGHDALRKMIRLVRGGPTDASLRHDHRPDDEPLRSSSAPRLALGPDRIDRGPEGAGCPR